MAADANKTFAQLGAILFVGAIAAGIQTGGMLPMLSAIFAVYVLLVITNSIRRGEINGRKNRRT
jgi:hypothetical protein